MKTIKNNTLEYEVAQNISVPHCFTTRLGGVSTGILESLNIAYKEGESMENVEENIRILARELSRELLPGEDADPDSIMDRLLVMLEDARERRRRARIAATPLERAVASATAITLFSFMSRQKMTFRTRFKTPAKSI